MTMTKPVTSAVVAVAAGISTKPSEGLAATTVDVAAVNSGAEFIPKHYRW